MASVRLLVLLLPLAACAGVQPRPVASNSYNVPNVGGAGLSPIGTGGIGFQRTLPRTNGPVPNYNVPNSGGAGLLPVTYGGHNVQAPTLQNSSPVPATNYNLPDSGGAGLVPINADGVGVQHPPANTN